MSNIEKSDPRMIKEFLMRFPGLKKAGKKKIETIYKTIYGKAVNV